MIPVVQRLGPLLPPMRLILTNRCNANCPFCHAEGFSYNTNIVMSKSVLCAAVNAAQALGLKRITLSGGEPTILDNFPEIVFLIRQEYPSCFINVSTNGYRIIEYWSTLYNNINSLNISIHSLNPKVWKLFTKIPPFKILDFLNSQKNNKKPYIEINCMLTEQNIGDIDELIKICKQEGYSITFMLPLPVQIIEHNISSTIHRIISDNNMTRIHLGSTPFLEGDLNSDCIIKIKLPFLSSLIKWKKCFNCTHADTCGEFFCALRVYPDGTISSCRIRPTKHSSNSAKEFEKELKREMESMTGKFTNWAQLLKLGILENYTD